MFCGLAEFIGAFFVSSLGSRSAPGRTPPNGLNAQQQWLQHQQQVERPQHPQLAYAPPVVPRGGSRSRSPVSHGGAVEMDDDDKKISTSYRSLGLPHIVGPRNCPPKRFRQSLINSCDPDVWGMIRLSGLGEEYCEVTNLLQHPKRRGSRKYQKAQS